ncbi:hypothetical protein M378DRAFT_966444 [Amanita muscaria Koide BX008]|uniref:Transmembrane protein n=1 Tax=Amanita muscaria (strain Koide BX008) TaxID=946122 RepID=A0A0C2WU55_AMAMK|nr:hypothetical protein M378DRAFT_966444 [Amanita muscaria Koide BX008]
MRAVSKVSESACCSAYHVDQCGQAGHSDDRRDCTDSVDDDHSSCFAESRQRLPLAPISPVSERNPWTELYGRLGPNGASASATAAKKAPAQPTKSAAMLAPILFYLLPLCVLIYIQSSCPANEAESRRFPSEGAADTGESRIGRGVACSDCRKQVEHARWQKIRREIRRAINKFCLSACSHYHWFYSISFHWS